MELEEQRVTIRSEQYTRDQERPNVYIGLHYAIVVEEYAIASNYNVLIGEDKHRLVQYIRVRCASTTGVTNLVVPREIKRIVYNTNKQNAERNLLQKLDLKMTTQLIFQDGFSKTKLVLTRQMKEITNNCPSLFNRLLPRADQSDMLNNREANVGSIDIEAIAILVDPTGVQLNLKTRMYLVFKSANYI